MTDEPMNPMNKLALVILLHKGTLVFGLERAIFPKYATSTALEIQKALFLVSFKSVKAALAAE